MTRRPRIRGAVRYQTLRRGQIPGDWPTDVRVVRQSDERGYRVVLHGRLGERLFKNEKELEEHLATIGTVEWSPHARAGPDEQTCPICDAGVPTNERYPAYICVVCKLEVVDELGRALVFSNVDATGGLVRTVVPTGEVTSEMSPDGRCWVRGIPCCADEGKFGGIVIEAVKR